MDDKVYSEITVNIKQEYDEYEAITNVDRKFRSDEIKPQHNSFDPYLEIHSNEEFKTELKQEFDELEVKHEEMDDCEGFSIKQEHDSMSAVKDEIDIEYGITNEKMCYSCDKCDYKTKLQCSLQVHIDSSHKQLPNLKLSANESGKKYDVTFESYRDVQVPMKRHTGKQKSKCGLKAENKFKCQFCHNTYKYKDSAIKHINAIHGGIKHECELCHKTFNFKHNLQMHMKVNHGNIKYVRKHSFISIISTTT